MFAHPSPGRRRWLALPLAALGLAAAAPAVTAVAAPSPAASGGVVQRSVSFTVRNVNHTAIPCSPNGKTYTIRGVITAPAGQLGGTRSDVTLIAHGLGYGVFFSNFNATPGYNFVKKEAAMGHTTVAINRLGYKSSGQPNGFAVCLGSQATILHQVIQDLRSGHYRTGGVASTSFRHLVLAGHSVGGLLVQAEAYSFHDVDGLVVLSYSDVVQSKLALQYAAQAAAACKRGGERNAEGTPGYAPYGRTGADFVIGHFNTGFANPFVVKQTVARHTIDPCGDLLSFTAAVKTDLKHLASIDVPVLVLAGSADNFFPPPAVTRQAALFTGSPNVTAETLPKSGHALTLHYNRNVFAADISNWLNLHGFAAAA